MTTTVTLKVASNNSSQTRDFTIQVKDKKFLNCIIDTSKDTITENDMNHIQEVAKRAGDAGILEDCDLNPQEKIKLAETNKYSEFYDIKLSEDGKFYEITVKPTSFCYPDPRIEDIKKDFGLRANVFMENNAELVYSREDRFWDTESNHNYDTDKLKGGDTFRIPVNEAHFTNGPAGFWRRLF